jgi:REP element-mobilizing transposase RayT
MANRPCSPGVMTFVTTTTYGSWMPGDVRGYVERGCVLPHNPALRRHAVSRMAGSPVLFTTDDMDVLERSILDAADEFEYLLTDLSIESWHLHWIVAHDDDDVAALVGRLKTRMRQALGRGRIWTAGYYDRRMRGPDELAHVRAYIARHHGCRLTDDRPVTPR